jgi:flagellar biosynthesis/type III secretory pathway chaperone
MEIRIDEVVTGLNHTSDDSFSMFPNPANNLVTVVCNEDVNIQIADVTGKVIQTIQSSNQKVNMIDTSNLSNGIYMISLINENGRSSRRLIIAH